MAAIAFDTLKASRRLKQAGIPEDQAEAVAEIMAEAFVFNLDALVTRDYLTEVLEAKFAAQDARMDTAYGGELRLHRWILALIVVTNLIPLLQGM